MSSRIFSAPENLEWKKAYTAAALEKDRTRLPGLVEKAIEKLSERLGELRVVESVSCEEIKAIGEAMDLLDALLSSLSYRDRDGDWTTSPHDS